MKSSVPPVVGISVPCLRKREGPPSIIIRSSHPLSFFLSSTILVIRLDLGEIPKEKKGIGLFYRGFRSPILFLSSVIIIGLLRPGRVWDIVGDVMGL